MLLTYLLWLSLGPMTYTRVVERPDGVVVKVECRVNPPAEVLEPCERDPEVVVPGEVKRHFWQVHRAVKISERRR